MITEVAFKLVPMPANTRTVAAWFSSPEGATTAAQTVLDSPVLPEALSVVSGPHLSNAMAVLPMQPDALDGDIYLLLARITGGMAAVTRQVDMVTGAAGASAAEGYEALYEDDAAQLWGVALGDRFDPAGLTAKIVVKPLSVERVLVDLERHESRYEGPGASIAAQMGFGVVLINWPAGHKFDGHKLAEFAFTLARQHGGSAIIERCPAAVKADIDVFGEIGASLGIMKRLKEQYDPGRVLSPGRFAGRI